MLTSKDKTRYKTINQSQLVSDYTDLCLGGVIDHVVYILDNNLITSLEFPLLFGLSYACESGQLEIVKYFIEQQHVKIDNTEQHNFLEIASSHGSYNIISYLIFEQNLLLLPAYHQILEDVPQIKQMFDSRELNKKLKKELTLGETHTKNKI